MERITHACVSLGGSGTQSNKWCPCEDESNNWWPRCDGREAPMLSGTEQAALNKQQSFQKLTSHLSYPSTAARSQKFPKPSPDKKQQCYFHPYFHRGTWEWVRASRFFTLPLLPVRDVWQNYFLFISVVLKISLSIFKKIPGQIQSQHLSKPLSPGYAGSNPCSLATS